MVRGGGAAKGGFAAFKVKDIPELQDLVASHVEVLEPGLSVLDARVQLGETTIDLIGVDKENALTLVALGFEADDEVLLRALDAYSFCLESPDAIRRLYPTARLSAADPPRVIVVAERIPETFLRKMRHLRVQRVDCLEFSVGLRFDRIGGSRATEPVTARARPAPEAMRSDAMGDRGRDVPGAERIREAPPAAPAADSARAALGEPAARPIGRDEPGDSQVQVATAAPLASRWRRLAEGGQVDEWKVKVVREYLQREFPTSVIYDFYAHDRAAQMFHLQDSYGDVIHAVSVAETFLQEQSEAEIRAFFDTHKLGRVLRQAGQAQVSVATAGVRIERA
jgi:hypothetical protein